MIVTIIIEMGSLTVMIPRVLRILRVLHLRFVITQLMTMEMDSLTAQIESIVGRVLRVLDPKSVMMGGTMIITVLWIVMILPAISP